MPTRRTANSRVDTHKHTHIAASAPAAAIKHTAPASPCSTGSRRSTLATQPQGAAPCRATTAATAPPINARAGQFAPFSAPALQRLGAKAGQGAGRALIRAAGFTTAFH